MASANIFHHCLKAILFYLQFAFFVTLGNDEVYTRFDRDAYLAARYGTTENHDGEGGPPIEDQKIMKIDNRDENRHPYDDPSECTTYLAQSSIPNSGLGMYTTVPYLKGESFPFPEIGILIQDQKRHLAYSGKKDADDKSRLLNQYPWAAQVLTLGAHEVGYGESIVPGLGMLANSHLGLVNAKHSDAWNVQPWRDGSDAQSHRTDTLTAEDAGRGAHSSHGRVTLEAQKYVAEGEELFVSYGEDWFLGREGLIGIVPGESQFKEADALLASFSEDDRKRREEATGDDFARRAAAYEKLLSDAHGKDKRLRMALPNNLQDVPIALPMGTARFSARDSIRSLEWLEENGACIDNIVSGVSTIPQAGRGAFATRSIKEGGPITTTPVLTLERDELELWEKIEETEEGETVLELVGHQLLLNYCYGHTNSSLLFFPYAPSVNFINHGSEEDRNAELRWSKFPYHKVEWLDATIEEMKDRLKTGLMFDVVATRDIRRGEEILLDYGKDWVENWDQHIEEWPSMMEEGEISDDQHHVNLTERLGLPTTNDFNQHERNPVVRTEEEQSVDPYPPHIMTICYFKPPETCLSFTKTDPSRSSEMHCKSRWVLTFDVKQLRSCTILTRETIKGIDWYTAQVVEEPSKGETETTLHLVEYMTRAAIVFVDRPYSKDQYARGVFRRSIGLPDGIVPLHWMDLDDGENEGGEGDGAV